MFLLPEASNDSWGEGQVHKFQRNAGFYLTTINPSVVYLEPIPNTWTVCGLTLVGFSIKPQVLFGIIAFS